MANENITLEEVHKNFESANLDELETAAKSAGSLSADAAVGIPPQVCSSYKLVRPFLKLVVQFPVPASWKKGIELFMTFMDAICPQS